MKWNEMRIHISKNNEIIVSVKTREFYAYRKIDDVIQLFEMLFAIINS